MSGGAWGVGLNLARNAAESVQQDLLQIPTGAVGAEKTEIMDMDVS